LAIEACSAHDSILCLQAFSKELTEPSTLDTSHTKSPIWRIAAVFREAATLSVWADQRRGEYPSVNAFSL